MSPGMAAVRLVTASLREGKFTSLGSYPKFFITTGGDALSHEAVRENLWLVLRATRDRNDEQWQILCEQINWEDPELFCSHTNERIESAYAEPEAPL